MAAGGLGVVRGCPPVPHLWKGCALFSPIRLTKGEPWHRKPPTQDKRRETTLASPMQPHQSDTDPHMISHDDAPSTPSQPPTPYPSEDFTPRTLNELFSRIVGTAMKEVEGARWLVSVRGTLGELVDNSKYRDFFVSLADDGHSVNLALPKHLKERAGVVAENYVRLVGQIATRINTPDHRLEFRLDVTDIALAEAPKTPADHTRTQDKLAILRKAGRIPFPEKDQITVTVIHAISGIVLADFMRGMKNVGDMVTIDDVPTSMRDSREIARAVHDADGDIVAIIRGGGDKETFAVFEAAEVLAALANKKAYRVLGLGHTDDQTLLDLVCDFAAGVPMEAGHHIAREVQRSKANVQVAKLEAERSRERTEWTAYIDRIEAERSEALSSPRVSTKGTRTLLVATVALVVGLFVGGVLATLLGPRFNESSVTSSPSGNASGKPDLPSSSAPRRPAPDRHP